MENDPKSIFNFYEMNGFTFSEEIISRYVLSLMTKPFVILTGISGTGKTKIAQLFAQYVHQDREESKREDFIAFVPVRPDWLDKKGLLGFFNILDERYSAPAVLRTLLSARDNPQVPHFVILDEMNLAKVEHYFSDFLSIMESRTLGNLHGEPLDLHERESAQTHDGVFIPGKLHIPPNVYFTGTVNVDESTYMFSPKVLDRANVMEFNEVEMEMQPGRGDSFQMARDNVLEIFGSSELHPFCSREDFQKCKEQSPELIQTIAELLALLKAYNLHFGYRVIHEMCRFLLLAKEHLDHFNADALLDIQILQKILPKFHGTQARLEEPLTKLLAYTAGTENQIGSDDPPEESRFPQSAAKITSMLRTLQSQGYTDFIE